MLETVAGVLARSIAGRSLNAAELEAALTKRDRLPQPETGAVAVLPVHGVLMPRANLFSDISGGTSLDVLRAQLRAAVDAEAVDTIVLDVDSPGGSVAGCTEFAHEVLKARTKKPVIAVAQYLMASAAYHISSAATEIIAAPSAYVGSVGVYTIHDDLSKALEEFGIKRSYIAAGKFKVEANETEPLSDGAREHLQAIVDTAYGRFIADISRGRGVSKDDVKAKYGQGRVLTADDALAAGMVDKVATLEDTIARLTGATKSARTTARAAAHPSTPAADTSQEPARVTDQDRLPDQRWRARIEQTFLELSV